MAYLSRCLIHVTEIVSYLRLLCATRQLDVHRKSRGIAATGESGDMHVSKGHMGNVRYRLFFSLSVLQEDKY